MKGLLIVALALATSSCSYVAGEATANYMASGGETIGYVENRPISYGLAGHGTAIGVGAVLNVVATMWDEKMKAEIRRKYAFDCMMRGKSEEECKIEASHRARTRRIYFYSLNLGKCSQSWWNPFSAFNKCYDEAFSDLESLSYGRSLEEVIYQVYYDEELRKCLPDPIKFADKLNELKKKYAECREKASKEAQKKLSELREKIEEYKAKSKS